MIGHCWFEMIRQDAETGADEVQTIVMPWEDYGIYLVSYDVPPPKPRIYRATIEGRDGTLDLSEWEGRQSVRYDDRTVTITMRDMHGTSQEFMSRMLGRKFYIHFDDDLDHYYRGRCEDISAKTRKHVTDIEMTFTCHPFRYMRYRQSRTYTLTHGHYAIDTINITGQNVIPLVRAYGVETGVTGNKFEILRDVTESYTLQNGKCETSGALFFSGETKIKIVNANTASDLQVIVSWLPEVI